MEGKVIVNVNVLDLRKATEASLAGIRNIVNVNVMITSEATSGLAARLSIGNLNTSVVVPEEAVVKTAIGQTFINKNYFSNLSKNVFFVYIGQIIFEPDVTVEDIQNGFYSFVVIGQVICPESLQGAVQSKAEKSIGQTRVYPALEKVVYTSLTIDVESLEALADGSEMAILGSLNLPDMVPNDLLERKLAKLFVIGGIECHAENSQTIKNRLLPGSGNVHSVPLGFEQVEDNLHLDSSLLEMWTGKKLMCSNRVIVDADVTPEMLEKGLAAISSDGRILVPHALKSIFLTKCDLLKTKVIFYEGELWLVDDARSLPASRFEFLDGKATLVVDGVLTVDVDVDPWMLADRLVKVHNFGVIHCTPAQMGAIQARLGAHDGVIDNLSNQVEEEDNEVDTNSIVNANYLAL
jgi:hypothetical protein